MDTLNIPQVDNTVGTPPTSQCSRVDEDNKHPFVSTSALPSCSTDQQSSTTPQPRSSNSPPPSCAICLGAFVNKCMPDICLHQFCFNCLLQWSKVKAVCPLCKRPFLSIIHNVRSNFEYDEHVIERPADPEYYLPNAPQPRHFQFRTTFTVDPRGELAIQQMLSSHPLAFPLDIGVYEPFTHRTHRLTERPGRVTRSDRRNYISSTGYRRSIYEQGLWVVANPDGADMHREATPEFYRNNEGAIARLVPWLNRELSVLMNHASTEQIANIIDQILAALPHHHILSRYMLRDVLQPYLLQDSEHFAHEFYNYMRSPLDMIGYDRSCVHGPRVIENVNLDDQTTSSDSDSTVQLVDQINSSNRFPLFMPAPLSPTPPPSTAQPPQIDNNVIEIDDSDGADSDVILQTPPPPTIVDLLDDSSDGGARDDVVVKRDDENVTESRQAMMGDSSGVQEVDVYDPGPSTSRVSSRKRCAHSSSSRSYRHDEYVVDRKTVLPLKIRLKRKRHQRSKRSNSKSKQCCKNGGSGYFSSSSNDTSLQSRLKRRRRFHKKKYYLRKPSTSSSSSHSDYSSSSEPAYHRPKLLFATAASSSSTDDEDDDNEPLALSCSARNKVKVYSNRRKGQHQQHVIGQEQASTSGAGTSASGSSGGTTTTRGKRKEGWMKIERAGGGRQRGAAVDGGGEQPGVPPPGVFECSAAPT